MTFFVAGVGTRRKSFEEMKCKSVRKSIEKYLEEFLWYWGWFLALNQVTSKSWLAYLISYSKVSIKIKYRFLNRIWKILSKIYYWFKI